MSSKLMKQFKNKCDGNKSVDNKKTYTTNDNIVVVPLRDKIVKVQSKECIQPNEIIEQVKDLFLLGETCKKGDRIEVSRYSNVCFDLICTGLEKNNDALEINLFAC
jgi:hypothetical protein